MQSLEKSIFRMALEWQEAFMMIRGVEITRQLRTANAGNRKHQGKFASLRPQTLRKWQFLHRSRHLTPLQGQADTASAPSFLHITTITPGLCHNWSTENPATLPAVGSLDPQAHTHQHTLSYRLCFTISNRLSLQWTDTSLREFPKTQNSYHLPMRNLNHGNTPKQALSSV